MKKLRHDVARRDHYEELTNTIIAKLEDGVLPWRRPWDPRKCSAGESPINPVTGRTYRGINLFARHVAARFRNDPRWMSYRQAAARGWQVRKGEKARPSSSTRRSKSGATTRTGEPSRCCAPCRLSRFADRRNPRAWRARGPEAGRRAHRRRRSHRRRRAAFLSQSEATGPSIARRLTMSNAAGRSFPHPGTARNNVFS